MGVCLSTLALSEFAAVWTVSADPEFPDVYTVAHYGFDGLRATAGTRVSKCIAFYDDLTQVDNAIIILRNSFKLPGYM